MCSIKKGVLRNFTKFTGKHLCQSLFLNNVAGLRPATLLKKKLWHRCFHVDFVKFLRTPFLQNTSARPLLLLPIEGIVTTKWGNYYKVGQYTDVLTLDFSWFILGYKEWIFSLIIKFDWMILSWFVFLMVFCYFL